MGRELTAGSGAVTPMWRRNSKGELFQVEEPDRNDYVTPPNVTRGRFQLSGISDVFTLTSEQYGESEKVRVEFLIEKVSSKSLKHLEGKRFTELYGWAVGPKSYFGQLLGKLRGRDVERGETLDPDTFIDTSFVSVTTLATSRDGQKQYPGINREAIEPDSIKLSPYVMQSAAEPALVPAGDVAEDAIGGENPFEGFEGDDDL